MSAARPWRARVLLRGATALVAVAILAASSAQAESTRPYRIGVLNEAFSANHPTVEGLKEGLRDLGLVEGPDVAYEIRFTKGDPVSTATAAAELVKAGVDVIFTSNESATLAAKKATQRIPIVFTLVGDPVQTGVVASLGQPGGNVTGISSRAMELAPKRLDVLKMLVPRLNRVWFVYQDSDITDAAALVNVREAARRLRIELLVRTISDPNELALVLKDAKPGDAVLAPAVETSAISAAIFNVARIPSIFPTAQWVERGALVSYGPDLRAQGIQSARLIAKILRGTRPQDLPVEGAERVDLAVNLNTAQQLALTVPPKILVRANVVHR